VTDPVAGRLVLRTVVVGAYVFVLAVAGGPAWLTALLSVALLAVWAAPLLLATNRGPSKQRTRPVSRPSR